MAKFKADVTISIHGHLTVEADSEGDATNKIMDGHYALSDITIDSDDWEVDFMNQIEEGVR